MIYIAAAFSAKSQIERDLNVQAARHAGFKIAKLGFYPVMPTVNTNGFEVIGTPEFWYEATLELMLICDAVYVVDGADESKGVRSELSGASAEGIPIYFSIKELEEGYAKGGF